jgi:hypothetical protein
LYIKLAWEILEDKFRYYEGAKYGLKPIPDDKYDKKEEIYKKICKILGKKPTACLSVGFPKDRASGRLVMSKLINRAN